MTFKTLMKAEIEGFLWAQVGTWHENNGTEVFQRQKDSGQGHVKSKTQVLQSIKRWVQ